MICIAENNGEGGVAGGGGSSGQASQVASGSAARGYGWPVIECVTGTPCEALIQLTKDYDGNVPMPMAGVSTVRFMARETRNSAPVIDVPCSFTSEGIVTLTLGTAELNERNGIWLAEFICRNAGGVDKYNFRAYLVIRKGIDGCSDARGDTITPMDVRLAIMDASSYNNELLDDLEFSDMQILHAAERCLNEFNELPPAISISYSMTSFPWKEHLIKGVVGFLMQEKSYQFIRNRMNYSASGFNLDKSDKGQSYAQLAQAARTEWKQFMMTKKTELNAADCFGSIDIPYFDYRVDYL